MIRTLSIIAILLTLWMLSAPAPSIDPALWNQYAMTELRGH
jgi:hypothetical protein